MPSKNKEKKSLAGRDKLPKGLKKHRVTVFVEWDKIVARGGMKAMKKHLTSQA